MIEGNLIEESESQWAAPVVLVPKKEQYRPAYWLQTTKCNNNFRQISVTQTWYPIVYEINNSNFISTIYLRAGYWQIAVHAEDQEKTASITPFGQYHFKRLPFELRNAPSTFKG